MAQEDIHSWAMLNTKCGAETVQGIAAAITGSRLTLAVVAGERPLDTLIPSINIGISRLIKSKLIATFCARVHGIKIEERLSGLPSSPAAPGDNKPAEPPPSAAVK